METPSNARVLVIEDEKPMRVALADLLTSNGYRVLTADNGETGLARAVEQKPDLILLDLMMPRLDGLTLCAELRRLNVATPVLMLTAKGLVQDRVQGLESGADDYLVKPFSSEELIARVRALLRRSGKSSRPLSEVRLGPATINFITQTATRGGEPLHLTRKEFAMLRLLAENPGEVISRERFLDAVWGYAAFPTTRTVDNHVAMLRAKLEPDPDRPAIIQTVHGAGYKLVPPDFAKQ